MVESLRKQQEKLHGLLKTIEDMDCDIERAKKVRKKRKKKSNRLFAMVSEYFQSHYHATHFFIDVTTSHASCR